MSRVHDALRRAESQGLPLEPPSVITTPEPLPRDLSNGHRNGGGGGHVSRAMAQGKSGSHKTPLNPEMLAEVQVVPFQPALESHLLDLDNNPETPAEEFRTLRTRLNHLATLQPLHSIIVTSPSPAEGKTFTAVNLALAESQLSENLVLLGDFDLRRPIVHNLFQIDRTPGLSDYLTGECTFTQALRKVDGTNLYLLPAGSTVKNPLELLNMRQAKRLFEDLPSCFNWAIFDTPPLLFSADANLLATLADGTILVVKIGSTTFDNVTRAMQSLCENNVLGIVANGARASELYSKYTYYYSKAD
ncbi:MAG TPA: CpsD/CapB family tyrosine-protein kinase [Bryobacteraceae bacterium]|nr:CpsD/CapB family tyrosine-protein kinase [Bryobacteraceae bacterium]